MSTFELATLLWYKRVERKKTMKIRAHKELDKKYRGFRYLVLTMDAGHRCGYVRIPKDHQIHGIDYNQETSVKMKDVADEEIGKRGIIPLMLQATGKKENVPLSWLFDVHGGITFTGKLRGFHSWWIGFDCAHLGDGKDESIMSNEYKNITLRFAALAGGTIRTTEYVEQECKNLIDQLIKYFPESKND